MSWNQIKAYRLINSICWCLVVSTIQVIHHNTSYIILQVLDTMKNGVLKSNLRLLINVMRIKPLVKNDYEHNCNFLLPHLFWYGLRYVGGLIHIWYYVTFHAHHWSPSFPFKTTSHDHLLQHSPLAFCFCFFFVHLFSHKQTYLNIDCCVKCV